MPHGSTESDPPPERWSPKSLRHRVPRGDRHQGRGAVGQDPGWLTGGRIPRLNSMASTLSSPRPMKLDRLGRYKTYLAGIAIACLVALALPSSGAVSGANPGQPTNSNLAQQLAVPAYIDPSANPGAWASGPLSTLATTIPTVPGWEPSNCAQAPGLADGSM